MALLIWHKLRNGAELHASEHIVGQSSRFVLCLRRLSGISCTARLFDLRCCKAIRFCWRCVPVSRHLRRCRHAESLIRLIVLTGNTSCRSYSALPAVASSRPDQWCHLAFAFGVVDHRLPVPRTSATVTLIFKTRSLREASAEPVIWTQIRHSIAVSITAGNAEHR